MRDLPPLVLPVCLDRKYPNGILHDIAQSGRGAFRRIREDGQSWKPVTTRPATAWAAGQTGKTAFFGRRETGLDLSPCPMAQPMCGSWTLRYRTIAGVQRRYTIGPYPAVSLVAAREPALSVLSEVAGGGDPAKAKKAAKQSATAARLQTIGDLAKVVSGVEPSTNVVNLR
jgi:hypothetical protein